MIRLTPQAALLTIRAQMRIAIPSASLRHVSQAKRERLLDSAFDQSPEVLAQVLPSGQVRDTADVSDWLFLAQLRSDLAGETRA